MLIRRKLGEITQEEKNKVLDIYDKTTALNEVALTLNNDFTTKERRELLENKINEKTQITKSEYEYLWKMLSDKYSFTKEDDENWAIDYKTNEIYAAKVSN